MSTDPDPWDAILNSPQTYPTQADIDAAKSHQEFMRRREEAEARDFIIGGVLLFAAALVVWLVYSLRSHWLPVVRRSTKYAARAGLAVAVGACVSGLFVGPNRDGFYSRDQWRRLWIVGVGAAAAAWIVYPRTLMPKERHS